jgi:hypothetical protein
MPFEDGTKTPFEKKTFGMFLTEGFKNGLP